MQCPKCLVGVEALIQMDSGTASYNHESGQADIELELCLVCPTCLVCLGKATHGDTANVPQAEVQQHQGCFLEDGDYIGEPRFTESVHVPGQHPKVAETYVVPAHVYLKCDVCTAAITLKEPCHVHERIFM